MHSARGLFVLIAFFAAELAGCSSNEASIIDSSAAGGAASGGGINPSGAASSLGGATAGGGTSTLGGASAGGTSAAAGSTNKGGATASGGNSNLGGSTSSSVGGTFTGGSSAKASGGGASSTGGSSNVSQTTGGKSSAGGATTVGGAATGGAATGGTAIGGQNATGGIGTGGLWRGPTPPTSTANFPFPQNRQATNCIYPTAYKNEDVQAVYDAWKRDLVSSQGVGTNCTNCRRVIRPAEPGLQVNSTVSEGIGYGMIIAVYMNDQSLFDDLWRYEQAHTWTYTAMGQPSVATSLMNWYIASDGTVASTSNGGQSGSGAATDADEDIAWALIMADKQWKGGQGSLSKTYYAYAQQLVKDIWTYETIDYRLPKNGSGWGSDSCLNISYFAPAYYRLFASVGSNAQWTSNTVPYVYQVISQSLNATNGNQTNGLVPAFSTSSGANADCGAGSGSQPHTYQYDSCRTPFRIGLDACLNESPDAISYVAKTSSFFAAKGATAIVDGYQLNGTPNAQFPGGTYNGLSAAFIGPAGVGAMHKQSGQDYQGFVDDVYTLLRQNKQWCGGQYYDESWTMMTLLMMTGNFLDYTKY